MISKIKVSVEYEDLSYVVEGDPEYVVRNILNWIYDILPEIDLARKLMFKVDYQKLIEILSKYAYASENGEVIFKEDSEQKLSLSNKILIALGLANLLYHLGEHGVNGILLQSLSKYLSSSSKTISSRLSELYSSGYVDKEKTEEGVLYRITLKGILKLLNM